MKLSYKDILSLNQALAVIEPSSPIPRKWIMWCSILSRILSPLVEDYKKASFLDKQWDAESKIYQKERQDK